MCMDRENQFKKVYRNPTRRLLQDKRVAQWRAVHKTKQYSESSDREFYVARAKVFNFHSIGLVLSTKLKTETSQRAALYKYKLSNGSGSNLMSVSTFKSLFTNATVAELNK